MGKKRYPLFLRNGGSTCIEFMMAEKCSSRRFFRAIESQCYVIAAAQIGRHNAKRASYGHSVIVDPWGTVVAACAETEGIAVAEIDHSRFKLRKHYNNLIEPNLFRAQNQHDSHNPKHTQTL